MLGAGAVPCQHGSMTTTTSGANLAARLEHDRPEPALLLDDRVVTHAALAGRVARWRGGLAAAGVGDGARVAVLAPPGEVIVAAHLAVLGRGAISVPLNPECPPGELARELTAAGVEVVIADGLGAGALDAALVSSGGGGQSMLRLDPAVLDEAEPDPDEIGILSRPAYLLTGMVLVAGAAYIAIGSTANFLRDGGYVHDIGWLLAISLGLALLLGFLGGVSFAVFRSWPDPPAWTYGSLRNAPLTTTPTRKGQGPSWSTTAAVLAAAVVTGMLTLVVGSGRSVATDIDRPISDWLVDQMWIDRLEAIDPFGGTIISIGFVALIGLSGFRCRVMAVAFPAAFAVSWIGGAILREIIERPRPTRFGDFESFPSGHLIQAVFIAGLVPLALNVLLADRRAATISRVVLGAGVIGTGLHRIHSRDHWALDVIAGITFGLVVVLAVHWAIEHRSWHRHCASCPWSSEPAPTPWRRGIVTLGRPTARRVGLIGAGLAIAAAAALAIGTTIIGLPTDPEGAGFGSAISTPFQLVLAASMAVAGALALRWRAAAAAIMALAATGLGLFASIEYRPLWAVALTSALLIPAVLTWLAWQPEETIGRIAVLAAVTTALLTTTALGSTEVYGHYFGPTHLDSGAEDLDSDAEWLWVGGVEPRSATVVAGGLDPGDDVTLRFWPASSEDERPATAIGIDVVPGRADPDGVARFELDGLEPAASYAYRIDEDDDAPPDDDGSIPDPDATFTTFDDRPQDLVIVAGACARTGSNGAVFDAMVAEQPDLYLALGDLHYGNLESTDPADHITLYGRSLSQDGQAALFSSVPTAYVWDDHDYGPNNADGSAPGREAVSEAYRRAVPHYGVDPDPAAPIAQVFTVGRVRFVLSDTRSHRSSASMLGQEQLAWLIDELVTSAADHAVVIWVNPTPWIGAAGASSDDWSGWADERRTIADALAGAEVDNLVMVSGDAHMVAIDDGTNSGYASDGWPGFPVLHAAALDRPGSVKGGPYSHGAVAGAGQYGRIEIDDDGGPTVTVRLSGHNWLDEELLDLELRFEAEPRS